MGLLLIVLALLASILIQPAQALPVDVRALPQLLNEASANPHATFRVTIQRINGNRNADRAVKANGGSKVRDMAVDAFVANVPGAAVAGLARNPSVKYINYDAPVRKTGAVSAAKLGTLYPASANAVGLWSSAIPLTGAGVGVAVLDTGINNPRPDFTSASGSSPGLLKSHGAPNTRVRAAKGLAANARIWAATLATPSWSMSVSTTLLRVASTCAACPCLT